MANMSYCRFHNTRLDLSDCLEAISSQSNLSDSEAKSGRAMFVEFLDFCQDNDIIDTYDSVVVADLFDSLKEKEDEEE